MRTKVLNRYRLKLKMLDVRLTVTVSQLCDIVNIIENVSQGGKLSKEGDTEWNMHRQYIVSGGWWDKLADHWMGKLSLLIPCCCLCWTTLLCTCTWFLMPWQSHRHAPALLGWCYVIERPGLHAIALLRILTFVIKIGCKAWSRRSITKLN